MRVIFDRSAFHGANFETLTNSPLQGLVASGRVSVFHTPIFLDETIQSYGSKHTSDDWRAHLAFAVEICNGGIFWQKKRSGVTNSCSITDPVHNIFSQHTSVITTFHCLAFFRHCVARLNRET